MHRQYKEKSQTWHKARAYRNGFRFVARRILHVLTSGLLRCNTRRRVLHRRRPYAIACSIRVSVRSRLNLQMRPRCLQQQTTQDKRDLLVLCYSVYVVDCWHLQKQGSQSTNASLQTENHGEQVTPFEKPQICTSPRKS